MPSKYLPRIAVMAALVTPASALALEQPHPGFEIGLRTGYALAAGRQGVPTGGTDHRVDEFVSGQWPFWLDVGYRLASKVYVGGFLQYGVGFVNDAQEFCRLAPSLGELPIPAVSVLGGRPRIPLSSNTSARLGQSSKNRPLKSQDTRYLSRCSPG
jgi:hypothetical protein